MNTEETKISNEELLEMVEDGFFFNFCAGMAINLGFKNIGASEVDVKFKVGGYDVRFDNEDCCFVLSHREYPFRIITAYINQVAFIGTSEEEVIEELLLEAKKELNPNQ